MKVLLRSILVILAVFFPLTGHAQTGNSLTGPNAVVQTDGTIDVGAINLVTNNAGPIRFFTNKTLRGYIDGTTGALTGFTIGSLNLPNNTYFTARNAADTANLDLIKANTFNNTVLNSPTGGSVVFAINSSTEASVSDDTFTFSGTATSIWGASTTDGTDNGEFSIKSYNHANADGNRGAFGRFAGNEHATRPGFIDFVLGGAAGNFRVIGNTGNTILLNLEDNGDNLNLQTSLTMGISANPADVGTTAIYNFSSSASSPQLSLAQGTADAVGALVNVYKSRATDGTADTIVAAGDSLGTVKFLGSNGTSFDPAAAIVGGIIPSAIGSPGAATDMPGKLDLQVSPDGTATLMTLFTAMATSNTALQWKFGDANGSVGGTASQVLTISASTADTDDDSTLRLAGGGAVGDARGAWARLQGEQAGGALDLFSANIATGHVNVNLEHASSNFVVKDTSSGNLVVVTNAGNISTVGTFTSSFASALGWTPVSGADTACNTTCTSACVFGFNVTAGNVTGLPLDCTDATADVCICAGAS